MKKKLPLGFFISLEGIEGTGKTTQAEILSEFLLSRGYDVVLTNEPGGTVIGNKIREILLWPGHKEMLPLAELLLHNAARAQHLTEKILPALKEGKVVIADRFTDSTIAYQGYGRGIDMSLIISIDKITTGCIRPHLTIVFDLDAEIGLMRNRGINKDDRLELEGVEFYSRVREGYLSIAERDPERVKILDAAMSRELVKEKIQEIVASEIASISNDKKRWHSGI